MNAYPPAGDLIPLGAFLGVSKPSHFSEWLSTGAFFASGCEALAAAIDSALRAAGHRSRTHVILPAYSCPSVLAAAIRAGATPLFVDFEPGTLRLCPRQLAATLNAHPIGAAVVADLFGLPGASPAAFAALSAAGVPVIRDVAQRPLNDIDLDTEGGDLLVASFGRGKPISLTLGGVLLARNDSRFIEYVTQMYPQSRSRVFRAAMRAVSYNLALWPPAYGIVRKLPGLRVGEVIMEVPASVRRLDSRLAAPAAKAAAHHASLAERRRRGCQAAMRLAGASGMKVFAEAAQAAERGALLRLPLMADSNAAAEELFQSAQHLGVSRMYLRTLPEFAGQPEADAMRRWPVAFEVSRRLVTMPTHGRLADRDLATLERLVQPVRASASFASARR